jgi:ribosomal protein S12 methylthiotransferase accessory factor
MALVEVAFPSGKKIEASVAGHWIPTDQSAKNGGEGSAPEPFELFLASIATCAGIYAKSFCDERDLPAPRHMELKTTRADDGRLSHLHLVLYVVANFPAKYDLAITRAMNLCAVKKQLREEIETSIHIARDGGLDS